MHRSILIPDSEFRRLFHEAPALFLVLLPDEQFTIVDATEDRLRATMTERADIVGRAVFDVFPDNPTDPAANGSRNLRSSLERVIATRAPDTMAVQKYDIPRPPSAGGGFEERYWSPRNVPVFDESGELIYIVHRVEDVTDYVRHIQANHGQGQPDGSPRENNQPIEAELLQRGRELAAANEELAHFAQIASHDLKAPLRAAGFLAREILRDYGDCLEDDGRGDLQLLIDRVRRMDQLIDGILRYSRVGRVREERVAVDLNRLLAEVIGLLAPPAHVQVTVRPLPTVVLEPIRIQQVFQNLLSNAIRYLDKPVGEIAVGAEPVAREWQFYVCDNGPGIEARHRERIFQLFQTLQPRDRSESTGIGLALVKKIVELYGGRVWLESTPGEGSTFFFSLPAGLVRSGTEPAA